MINCSIRTAMHRLVGFTLIELMIVVAVIGILAMVAYPSYLEQVRKSRRADAKVALMDAVNRQEQYFLDFKSYTGTLSDLGLTTNSPEGFYAISISGCTAPCTGYTLTAAALGNQANDTECGDFTITSQGVKSVSGTANAADCW